MDQILDLPSTNQRTLNYAGFWIRAGALIIDSIIVTPVFFVAAFILGYISEGDPDRSAFFIAYPVFLVGVVAYFVGMETSSKQGTLGKMAVGIKVGAEAGNKISLGKAFGRYFSKLISGMILYIGYMMAGWDPKKQALHDKIAGTYVFYK